MIIHQNFYINKYCNVYFIEIENLEGSLRRRLFDYWNLVAKNLSDDFQELLTFCGENDFELIDIIDALSLLQETIN